MSRSSHAFGLHRPKHLGPRRDGARYSWYVEAMFGPDVQQATDWICDLNRLINFDVLAPENILEEITSDWDYAKDAPTVPVDWANNEHTLRLRFDLENAERPSLEHIKMTVAAGKSMNLAFRFEAVESRLKEYRDRARALGRCSVHEKMADIDRCPCPDCTSFSDFQGLMGKVNGIFVAVGDEVDAACKGIKRKGRSAAGLARLSREMFAMRFHSDQGLVRVPSLYDEKDEDVYVSDATYLKYCAS